jgi:hypothetical protein
MYGKHFGTMYEGSMIGAGAVVFAVMGYVIARQVPDAVVGSQVELNPKLLSFVLGESEASVEKAIEFLCLPDAKSRTPTNDGRRLVRVGEYAYQVVNGAKYSAIRDEEQRREQNRDAQRRFRAKKRVKKGLPLPGEQAYVKTVEEKGVAAADAQMDGQALVRSMVKVEKQAQDQMERDLASDIEAVKEPVPFVSPWGNGG